jgi:diguanylate cyclase (GGDEF)-like protein
MGNYLCLQIGDLGDYVKVILVEGGPFEGKEKFLNLFSRYLENTFKNVKRVEAIKKEVALVDIDDVTGLYNSRRLHKDLSDGVKRWKETGEKFSLLFIDIDHFKNVNDGHGHLIGTGLLSELAKELKKILRLYDHLYRYGGDEFVILLPKADSLNAKQIGDRVLEVVKEKVFIPKKGEKEFKLSLSIGVASFPDHATTEEDLLAIADKMMYHAKELGRGRVCLVNEMFDKKTG